MASETVEDDPFYNYWNALLDGEQPPFHDGCPEGGSYWMKGKNGSKTPVLIDYIDKKAPERGIGVWVDGTLTEAPGQTWLNCGRNAVAPEAYVHRMTHGRWPDEGGPILVGDNNPPPEAVHELLPYMVERIRAWFVTRLQQKLETPADIQAAADHAKTLRDLKGKAKKLHDIEVRPLLDAENAVHAKYNPHIKEADALLAEMGKAVAAYETIQREQTDIKVAEAREALVKAGITDPAAFLPASGPTKIKSSTGKRGFTVKPVETAKVVDQDALYCATKHKPEVMAFFAKLAQTSLDSGTLLPGVFKKEGLEAK